MAQIPMHEQLYVGRGLNSASGKVYGVAIDFDEPQPVASGQDVVLSLESIVSSRELTEKLNINASASFKTLGWGASAEFSLAQSREISNYYTYALVRVFVKNPPLLLRNPRLKPEALNLLKMRDWEAFSAAYGWEYVDGYVSGGSYYALIEIQTQNETEQRDVKTKLSGFYGPFKAEASVEVALKEIASRIQTNVFVAQRGGSGDLIETSLEEMIQQARIFPELAKNAPVPIIALTADYPATVPLPDVPAPDSLARIQQKNTLEDLGREYLKLRDYKASLQFILDHLIEFDEFRGMEEAQLMEKRQEYQTSLEATGREIDEVINRANSCAVDYNQCQTYTPDIHPLPLPTIGGQLMNLKQMEEKLAALTQELQNLRVGSNNFRRVLLSATQDENNPSSDMMWINSTKQDPPYINWQHSTNGGTPQRYGYIQAGDFGNDVKRFAFVADGGARADIVSGNHVNVLSPRLYIDGNVGIGTGNPAAKLDVHGELRIKGHKPFHVKYCGPFMDQFNTGYSESEWVATIAGFRALEGDINEKDSGDIIQVYPYRSDGVWWIGTDFRSQNIHERWEVWVLFTRRELVELDGW